MRDASDVSATLRPSPRRAALALAALLTGGCVDHARFQATATSAAAAILACEPEALEVARAESWAYQATGCGRTHWVRCHHHRMTVCCRPTSEREARAVFAPHRDPTHRTGGGQVCDE